jgi:hypothetical protein
MKRYSAVSFTTPFSAVEFDASLISWAEERVKNSWLPPLE